MNIRLASDIQKDSIVDGEGIRTVIWTQGCSHNCLGCHNPSTHSFKGGKLVNVEKIKQQIDVLEYQNGITFSGGDPMFQPEACLEIAKYAKKKKLNIWCYTGFTFEELLKISEKKTIILDFLKTIDVLIDGKFDINQKSLDLKYRGSKNQRIINVKRSLKENRVCIFRKYMSNQKKETHKKRYLFI